jgi:protein-L-isoaspartate(D-aspartate) O-methyltransferase
MDKIFDSYERERARMVRSQIEMRKISDPRLLKVMRQVPRHLFVPEDQRFWAYRDSALPIGSGQTISQPYIVALMTEALALTGDEKVLEVGTGSGYQAAILAELAREVHTIELHAELSKEAKRIFDELGLANIHVHVGDGSQGLPDEEPFDAIMVTAAAPKSPQVLLDQLKDGGRMVIPVGSRRYQELRRWVRRGDEFDSDSMIPVMFVPLLGRFGWGEDFSR